ncbi:MAG: serine/threonine-protein kinase [Solirubrobacteraceae bacterium]
MGLFDQPTAAGDPRPRRQVGRYELLDTLGSGGMGIVYKARDGADGREVALKLMTQVGSRTGRERFADEIGAYLRVRHPHVVTMLDSGEDFGQPYLVMELIAGADLVRHVALSWRMSTQCAVEIIAQVGSALDAVHDAGFVHRDVKPSNVLVASRPNGGPHAYLADFGLAKAVGATRDLSRTGVHLGTLAFSSPEQLRGQKDVDHRTDVFSLGCLLYWCLTGQPPFRGRDQEAIRDQILLGRLPPATGARGGLPPAIDGLLARAVSPDRQQRPGSAKELVAAAGEVLAPGGRPPRPVPATAASPPPTRGPRRPAPAPTRPDAPAPRAPAPPPPDPAPDRDPERSRRRANPAVNANRALIGLTIALAVAGFAVTAARVPLLTGSSLAITLATALQGLMQLRCTFAVSSAHAAPLEHARDAVLATPGWRIVRADASSIALAHPRRVEPAIAIAATCWFVLPGVAYLVRQSRPATLTFALRTAPAGDVLVDLHAVGAEGFEQASRVGAAIGRLP